MTQGPKPPDDPQSSGEWRSSGPSLDADGRLVGGKPKPQLSLVPPEHDPNPLAAPHQPLELKKRPPPRPTDLEPVAYREDLDARRARQRRRRLAMVTALLMVLGAAALGAFMYFPALHRLLPALPQTGKPSLLLMSEPSGAAIVIDGQTIGATPYAGDNVYTGTVQFELRLGGYQSFRGSFQGGREAHLSAQLKKK